jgi:hypothetical protein
VKRQVSGYHRVLARKDRTGTARAIHDMGGIEAFLAAAE